jgi:DNA-binding Xre family transcriptional regulator
MSYMTSQNDTAMLGAMPSLRWKLKELLDQNEVSAYSIAKDTGLSLPSIYRLTNNHARSVQLDTLEAIMTALEKRTGKSVKLTDLLTDTDEPN